MRAYLLLVLLMGLVTYIPRWLPLEVLSRRALPSALVEWLDLIPAAILSALIVPALALGPDNTLEPLNLRLLVALPTFALALMTRSLGLTVIAGMLLYWLAGLLV